MADDFILEWAARSDVGQMRANNEDAVCIAPEYGFAVLADGMGGYNAGEVASRMAVEGVSDRLARWLLDQPVPPEAEGARATHDAPAAVSAALRMMEDCAHEANRAIFDDACVQADHAGMGTTLVMALAYQGQLLIGHVGDSRAYRWRDGALAQLTRDHTLLQEQLDAGLLTPKQAGAWRYRNLLTRGLGVDATVQVDTQAAPLQTQDVYLLCSDGLTDMVSDAEIAAVLGSGLPPSDMAQVLIDQANTAGGRDNITVALMVVAV